ncbi:MAG: efflux RND transporter periplasmic adaptor subunit [Solirubrobacteraceae bacterium]
MTKKNNFLTYFLIVLFLGGFIFSVKYIITSNSNNDDEFETKKPFYSKIDSKSLISGEIIANEQVEIKPNLSGIISSIYVKPGQTVNKGDLIATINLVPNATEINEVKSKISADNILLENEKRNFDRVNQLYKQGVLPKIEYEKAETNYKIVLQNISKAQRQLQIVQTGGLANNQIKATISGTVLDVFIEKGAQVVGASGFNTGTTIASLGDLNNPLFKGKVDEIEAGALKIGMPLKISLAAINDKKFDAILTFISPKGNIENGSVLFEIQAEIKLAIESNIRIGYSANAEISHGKSKKTLVIDESLIQFDKSGNPFLEVKNSSGNFEKRTIQTGISDGSAIEIISGVTENNEIKVWNKAKDINQPTLNRPNKEY